MSNLIYMDDHRAFPSLRNAEPGSKEYDYVLEYINLRKWALEKYGPHKYDGFDDTKLARIRRPDAITMTKWWEDVSEDIDTGYQFGDEVHDGLIMMQVPAFGSAAAASRERKPTTEELERELNWAEAAHFWEGMRNLATSIGAAKLRPTLFDKGVLLWESFAEAAEELPGRVIEQGKKIGDDIQSGVDKVVTTAKWVGIIGGGLLGVYVVSRVLPARKPSENKR